jgi:hypothetical protein
MSINCKDLRELVVRPTLQHLRLWSPAAEDLVLGTAAQESALGTYLHQVGGPALGIYQMEPATERDIWDNYLAFKELLADQVSDLITDASREDKVEEMIGNLYYATAMCRIHYLRVPEAIPVHKDIKGMAAYWKKYYNTPLGAGTEDEFISNFKKYVK